MDYYWHFKQTTQEYPATTTEPTEKERIQTPCSHVDYNYFYYLVYILYTPLYICGPIITFNDFMSQMRTPCSKLTWKYVMIYALRLAAVL